MMADWIGKPSKAELSGYGRGIQIAKRDLRRVVEINRWKSTTGSLQPFRSGGTMACFCIR